MWQLFEENEQCQELMTLHDADDNIGQAAKDEYEFGNSLEDVSNKKKKILERQLATEERAVNTTQPLLLSSSLH